MSSHTLLQTFSNDVTAGLVDVMKRRARFADECACAARALVANTSRSAVVPNVRAARTGCAGFFSFWPHTVAVDVTLHRGQRTTHVIELFSRGGSFRENPAGTCVNALLLVLLVGIDVTEWRQSPTDASKPLPSWRFNLWRWHLRLQRLTISLLAGMCSRSLRFSVLEASPALASVQC